MRIDRSPLSDQWERLKLLSWAGIDCGDESSECIASADRTAGNGILGGSLPHPRPVFLERCLQAVKDSLHLRDQAGIELGAAGVDCLG